MSTSIVKCARRVSAHGKENRLFTQHIRIKRIQKHGTLLSCCLLGKKKDGNENISFMKNKHWFFKSRIKREFI